MTSSGNGPSLLEAYREGPSYASLIQFDANTYGLTHIACSNRGRGHASKLLTRICSEADNSDITLMLSIQPDPGGMDADQLASWYRRNGFQEHPEDSQTMVRAPR